MPISFETLEFAKKGLLAAKRQGGTLILLNNSLKLGETQTKRTTVMKRKIVFLLFFLFAPLLFSQETRDRYPEDKFKALYEAVSKYYEKEELKRLLGREEIVKSDELTEKNLQFIISPLSIKRQAQNHKEFFKTLVNEERVKRGVELFEKYRPVFLRAYKTTGVHPADVVAILNWESKLGAITGEQRVVKIFTALYFFSKDLHDETIKRGEFKKEGAMSVEESLKRIKRLEKGAFSNLVALLIQAKERNFDPAAVKGSWAGAIGFPQFMPASMKYALDGNDDGKIDLFTMEDAIMSIANYLKLHDYLAKGREHAFRRYNRDKIYVKGVKTYGDMARKAGITVEECSSSDGVCPLK